MGKLHLYVDLDGVLVNFMGRLQEHFPNAKDGDPDEILWPRILSIDRFWEDLEWMPDGRELWNFIEPYNPTILSACSKNDGRSFQGKKVWLEKHLPGVPNILVPQAPMKKDYAHGGAILVDDLVKNIVQWTLAGGISVHHTSTKETIPQLKQLLRS